LKVIEDIVEWHHARNLIEGSTDFAQFQKLLHELVELMDSLRDGLNPIDDVGDIAVVLINICERNDIRFEDCLEYAYDEIKDRKGRMVNGLFVKEE